MKEMTTFLIDNMKY